MIKIIYIISGFFIIDVAFSEENKFNIDPNQLITLHFTADNRLPYKVGVPFISYDTFTEAVHGLLIEATDSNLSDFDNKISLLEYAEPNKDDPTVIHLKLKKNLYFNDGNTSWEATADDLKFSMARFFFTDLEINAKHRLSNIIGVEKIKSGSKYDPDLIKAISVINKYEITIRLKKVDPSFIEKISHVGTPLVSIKTLKENYFSWKKWPVGVGPYQVIFSDSVTGETILENRSDSKFPEAQKYIRFISSSNNEGDIFWKDMWELDPKKYKKKILKVSYGTLGIFFNFDSPLGRNENFRKAISFIINRDEIVNNLDSIIKNSEIIPISIWGRANLDKKQNLALAKEYINKVPKSLLEGTIEINTFGQNNNAINDQNFVRLKNQIEELGIKISFKLDDGKLKLGSPMHIVGIQAIHKDPSYVFGYFRKGSFYKNSYPKDDKFIEDNFNRLMNSIDTKEKSMISVRLSTYLTESAIVVPLWDLYSIYLYDSKKIDIATFHTQPGGMRFKIWEVKALK